MGKEEVGTPRRGAGFSRAGSLTTQDKCSFDAPATFEEVSQPQYSKGGCGIGSQKSRRESAQNSADEHQDR